MPAPLMILADEAEAIAVHLSEILPGERYLPVTEAAGVAAALEQGPEAVLAIRSDRIGRAAYRQTIEAPRLRFFQVGGSGYEWLGPWDTAQVKVANAAGVLAPYLAETVIGALIMLNNGLLRYAHDQAARRWVPRAFRPLAGQSLLVVGAGSVGTAVALRARALGMHVTGLSRQGALTDGYDHMAMLDHIDEELPKADIVSCHLRLNEQTAGFFDAERFARMKPGALFLNSARGGHVEEPALIEALATGRIAAAWLDVFQTEPLPADSPLWAVENLLITPHASDMIEGWALRFADLFAENLGRHWSGERLINAIDPA